MLIDYTLLRASRPLAAEDRPPTWTIDDGVDLLLDRCQLTPHEVASASADPALIALAPAMPIRAIPPKLTDVIDELGWADTATGVDRTRASGEAVTVAVLDSAIDAAHPAFAGLALEIRNFTSGGGGGGATALAGRMVGRDVAGRRLGVARGIERALIGQVLDGDGAGTTDDLYEALVWAARGGARVIATALELDVAATIALRVAAGWTTAAATATAIAHYRANARALDLLTLLINGTALGGAGALVIAAAGDDSWRGSGPARIAHAAPAAIPAASIGAIAVGAVCTHPAGLIVAPFSNLHPRLCAPGVAVPVPRNSGGIAFARGTAVAAAEVAGIAALWCQHLGPGAHAARVVAELVGSARRGVFAAEPDPADIGAGLVTAPP